MGIDPGRLEIEPGPNFGSPSPGILEFAIPLEKGQQVTLKTQNYGVQFVVLDSRINSLRAAIFVWKKAAPHS